MQREDAVAALDPLRYGLHPTSTYDVRGILSFPDGREAGSSMADIVEHLRRVYIGDIGWEFFHQHSKAQRNWWCDYLEREGVKEASKEESRRSHALVTGSEELDRFLAKKFPSVKVSRSAKMQGAPVATLSVPAPSATALKEPSPCW